MQDIWEESLHKLTRNRIRRERMIAIVLVLSLIVSMDVFWVMRQPGLTLAGDADCRITEHIHDEACQTAPEPCALPEHTHTVDCYSDQSADAETQLDWQKMFADYPYTGDLRKDLVGIAQTQVGYTESAKNFQVDDTGQRHGYTRYGAWYGAPYNDWATMFISFCLHYAQADPGQFPGNTGAASMAQRWKQLGHFAQAGTYDPVAGDLVFFTNNTAAIVTQVQSTTAYVIRADVDNKVVTDLVQLTDPGIAGWGITEASPEAEPPPEDTNPPPEETKPPEETTTPAETTPEETKPPEETDLLDISNGPVFYIFEQGQSVTRSVARYALRTTPKVTELISYLEANNGSYFFTLLDYGNKELPKDENGNYIAQANKGYKLTLTFHSPDGFLPGIYEYQIPNGLMVDGGEGTFVLTDGSTVGSWIVTDTGLITLTFNEEMNNHADITISSTLGIHFPEQQDPIDFDGLITVKVEPPAQQLYPTKLSKWGSPDQENGKLNWTIRIDGFADSQIPGNILTDQATLPEWGRPHTYTAEDIADGISFGVSDPNGGWHNWLVTVDDPHLIWDENGWSYKIPKTVICDYCGELELGNEGWVYLINYHSTPTNLNTPGTFDYENKATIDGQTAWGWSDFNHGAIDATITKEGSFISDAGGGAFLWEFQTTIPGRVVGQKADYSWFVMDEMRLLNENGTAIGWVQNDAHLSTVLATYNGTTIKIPRIQDATDADMFAWDNSWTATEGGISYNRTLNLLCRCQCTEESCHWSSCGDYWFVDDDGAWKSNGFCQCWTETQNMVFTFIYKTEDISMIETFGSMGYKVYNLAQLYHMPESDKSVRVAYDDAVVEIPNLFEKQLTHDFDGYTANYKITVNEAKLVLTDGSPLHIRDEMTKTLAYISGSLVIYAEDVNGVISTLRQGTDYTVAYDGSGDQKDAQGQAVHVLDIEILHPQPVMYILDYDTTLIMPEQLTGAIKYSNSATITLWGESIKNDTAEKVYAEINISTKSYKVNLYKTAALTGQPLPGAVFGLYNENGGLIDTKESQSNGQLAFKTSTTEGIILREHTLYYVQELRAPPGYQLDNAKHWLCFCDKGDAFCATCNKLLTETNGMRIPPGQDGLLRVANELMDYNLPATGGPGIYPILLASVILILTPLVYMTIQRRKRERRGVG